VYGPADIGNRRAPRVAAIDLGYARADAAVTGVSSSIQAPEKRRRNEADIIG
jgi:hypothetical protein